MAAPAVVINSPADGSTVGDTASVAITVTDEYAISSAVADINGISQTLVLNATQYKGGIGLTTLPAGNVTLTVTVKDALGGTTTVTETLDHEPPAPPPPPPPPPVPVYCTALDPGTPNLTVVNGVVGDTILDYDDTRILYAATDGTWIKSRVDGTTTLVTSTTLTSGALFSAGVTWPAGTWRGGAVVTRPIGTMASSFVVGGDWAAWSQGSTGNTVYRENLVTGVKETYTFTGGLYGNPNIDATGTGDVYFTNLLTSSSTYNLRRWSAGSTTASIAAEEGVAPSAWGTSIAYRHHWTGMIFSAIYYRPNGGAEEVLDAPPTGFLGPNAWLRLPGVDYRVRGTWVAYTHVVGTQLQTWTRAPDGTKSIASPYTMTQIAGLSDTGEVVVDDSVSHTRSVTHSNGDGTVSIPIDLGSGRGAMKTLGGVWYESLGCALFRVGASAADPGSALPVAGGGGGDEDASADAGGDASTADDASVDAGDDADASIVDDGGVMASDGGTPPESDAGAGGGSTSSSSSSSGGSSSSSGGDAPPDDVGGCAVGASSSPSGAFALLAVVLAFGRRRRRG